MKSRLCWRLADMQAKLIRTPLGAHQTSWRSARVLRLIRFASRLGFKIDPESEAVHGWSCNLEALKWRSVERGWIRDKRRCSVVQYILMPSTLCSVRTKSGYRQETQTALHFINRFRVVLDCIYDPTRSDARGWLPVIGKRYDCLDVMRSNESPGSIYKLLVRSSDAADLSWVLAAFITWAPFGPSSARSVEEKSIMHPHSREGIKANNGLVELVMEPLGIDEITKLKDAYWDAGAYIWTWHLGHGNSFAGMPRRAMETPCDSCYCGSLWVGCRCW